MGFQFVCTAVDLACSFKIYVYFNCRFCGFVFKTGIDIMVVGSFNEIWSLRSEK